MTSRAQSAPVLRRRETDGRCRRALTLFEMLLVLTLLVVLAGFSMPAMEGAFSGARLRHGSDRLRTAWAQARLASLESGELHTFRCVWGSGQFHVQAEGSPGELADATELPEVLSAEDIAEVADERNNLLPEGVFFAAGQWETTLGQKQIEGAWSEPLYFYPDGTTSDATVLLENAEGRRLRVTLRGLTGVSLTGVDEQ